MFNHFSHYNLSLATLPRILRNNPMTCACLNLFAPSKDKKHLTKNSQLAHNEQALAKSSVSDWHRYIKVTQARHYLKVRAIFVSAVSIFYGGLCVGRKPAISLSSMPTRAVCHPNWHWGGRFENLSKETSHV